MNDILPVDLYHGTSTIFLDSIIENKLGGINPIKDWNVLELSKEVYQLSEQHLKETELFKVSSASFRVMAEQQNSGRFNWQHGNTYLSASIKTAARYATNKQYGSELLTYTINFLKELINLKIQYVTKDLFQKYSKIFGLIEASPSPIMIQAKNVPIASLTDEHGNNPKNNLFRIYEVLDLEVRDRDDYLQQCNFRLKHSTPISEISIWLVNVQEWNPYSPKYNLYEIKTLS